jgi:hypothetical protein
MLACHALPRLGGRPGIRIRAHAGLGGGSGRREAT